MSSSESSEETSSSMSFFVVIAGLRRTTPELEPHHGIAPGFQNEVARHGNLDQFGGYSVLHATTESPLQSFVSGMLCVF